ncbi:MAG: trigger factor, partial [Pseudomonadota bacterium]
MKTDLEELSPVKRKIRVEIDSEEVDKKLKESYRILGKRAKIPGFRQGKIPRKILENYFGNQVLEDVAKDLVKDTLPQAVEEAGIIPITMPMVENETLKEGGNFKYSALMEIKPQFALKDYKGIEVEKEICHVSDEDAARHLEEIRKGSGNMVPLEEDRGIQNDDFAVIDYDGFEGDQPLDGIKSENFLLKVGSNDFHPDLEKGLLGLKKGDRTEARVVFEEEHPHKKLAGKTVDFKIHVSDIKVMELPELDDEFAKGLGADFKDLNDLRDKIKEDLVKREEMRIDRDLKRRLMEKLSETVDFELPESLVKTELDYAVQSVRQNLSRSGTTIEKAGIDLSKLKEEFKPASEKRVKNMLILGEVARENDLTIEEAELMEGFSESAQNIGQEPDVLRKYYEA